MRLFLQARVFYRNSVLVFRRVSYIKVSLVIFLITIQNIVIIIFAYKTNANISVTYVISRNYVLDRICQEIRNICPENKFTCQQEPYTCSYPRPKEFNALPHILLLKY